MFIIKAQKFWEKQKATVTAGKYNFELIALAIDALKSHFDISQLPESFGGTLSFDHTEWIRLRLVSVR